MTDLDERIRSLPVSRRVFLQGSTLAGFATFLAACGAGSSPAPTGGGTTVTGPLHFANWAAYIDLTTDPGPDGQEGTDDDEYVLPSPTLDAFTAKYGVEVDYADAKIEDNETFMATIRQQLQSGRRHRLGPDRPDGLDGGPRRQGRLGGEAGSGARPDGRGQSSGTSTRGSRGTPTWSSTTRGSPAPSGWATTSPRPAAT